MLVRNHMAILRNLLNILDADVSQQHINKLQKCFSDDSWGRSKVLPFRFISAARYAPQLEPSLEVAMLKCLSTQGKLPGHTVLLVDVSASMDRLLSAKSDISRLDAANGVAMLLRDICDKVSIYSFSMKLVLIPPRRGFALRDAIYSSQEHSGTPLGEAIRCIYAGRDYQNLQADFGLYGYHNIQYQGQELRPDRLIVITDEQSCDKVPNPVIGKGYMINIASARNGVGYGPWIHIDGFSEAVINYIQETEAVGDSMT